ncbi:H-type small acid-soluble spore protein [Bacillus sp. ISL-47]|uniref:H-type small acid-soluble spore protein n=1 Tax=Bacillus sp. ISL-47 TaxID=2819130 RepID=UPI001BEA0639|nr:H-type small acid-soluble spore protein [Bacillus sp. ISL-47]MBT2691198.1 H-type small acid-soluble spore protein [Bacillus sp. ISL-47]MBT2709915.1 H-type small acid-soluble spore protein [Pseudomonas sp. ISL-84]
MNIGRAREISESADMVGVIFNGNPVIIQHVDEQTKMARIYTKADPENEMDVHVNSLIEE